MVNLIIDRIHLQVPEGTTILEAARSVGIGIPSLCYLKGINEIGSCRVCVVEVKGVNTLSPPATPPSWREWRFSPAARE